MITVSLEFERWMLRCISLDWYELVTLESLSIQAIICKFTIHISSSST